MFTGIIKQQVQVMDYNTDKSGAHLMVGLPQWAELTVGESIAVNGVCLTISAITDSCLVFEVSPETLKCTNLGLLELGELVNLERALAVGDRFGGHYVTGHIDTTAVLKAMIFEGDYLKITVFDFGMVCKAYLIPKGSISLDGVSLTINEVNSQEIVLMLIPHTLQCTRLHHLKIGHVFNVEFDYLSRVISHQLEQLMLLEPFKKEVFS